MKIKEGFILREVADSFIVIAVGKAVETFNGVINLNKTGAKLWKKLETGCDEAGLIKAVLDEYDVDEGVAKEDVKSFIEKLVGAGLIE